MKTMNLLSLSAELSLDGRYRWTLSRTLGKPGRTALWIGVNPSTADAEKDDHSIRKLYGFGERLNIRTWWVGNLFSYRATDVNELALVQDPVGPGSDYYLTDMIKEADLVIAGWGRIDKVPPHLRYREAEVIALVHKEGKQLMCWGTCQDGSPRHPLMVPYSTNLEVWR